MSKSSSTVARALESRQLKFTLPEKSALPNQCEWARNFEADCRPLLEKARKDRTELAVNVALLQLQQKYFDYYASAPVAHRKHDGAATTRPRKRAHSCIFEVYRYLYDVLDRLRVELNPPPVSPPPPPPPPSRPQINGIFIGEDLGGV